MKSVLALLCVICAIVGATATGILAGSQQEALELTLANLEERRALLESAIESTLSGSPKRADQLKDTELDRLMKGMDSLTVDMRTVFTLTRLRHVEQALVRFESQLKSAFAAQGLSKEYPKVLKEAKDYYATVPKAIGWTSRVWHSKESKDIETDKLNKFEEDIGVLLHGYNYLLRRSARPFVDLEGSLKALKAQRDELQNWINKPVQSVAQSLLEAAASTELDSALEVEVEADAELEAEADAEAEEALELEEEAEEEADADAEAEAEEEL